MTNPQSSPERPPLALYIHWPFCKAKCPYCDFNSHVRASVDAAAWQQALLAELDWMAGQAGDGFRLTSVFFGGGTPSLMPPALVGALLDRAAALFPMAGDIEITLEANPTSSEAANFRGFRSAGVNRLSLGVQSLRAEELAFLGRQHDVAEARGAVALAASLFPRYSFDLIYARPGQTLDGWRQELEEALAMAVGHLSLYQLTVEPETPFERVHRAGGFRLPEEGIAAELYDYTVERCTEAGLQRYEISNVARPGQESRHNLSYWQGDSYLGIGPGAHGRLRRDGGWIASAALRSPERWLETVARKGHGMESWQGITPQERAEELVMTGLRLAQGLSYAQLRRQTGLAPEAVLSLPRAWQLAEAGWLELDGQGVRLTPQGLPLLDTILGQLLT